MGRVRKGSIKMDSNARTARRFHILRNILRALIRRRTFSDVESPLLYTSYKNYKEAKFNRHASQCHRELISTTKFKEVFPNMGDEDFLLHFRLRRSDLAQLVTLVTDGYHKYTTARKMYNTNTLLSTYVVLKRLATPQRWYDLEKLFRNHTPQLSKMFLEMVEDFEDEHGHLITGNQKGSYMASRAGTLASKAKQKTRALDNRMGFMNGTLL